VWTRRSRWWWLAAALTAYGFALLSKETATLLPLLLLSTPRSGRPFSARAGAVAGFVVLAIALYAWRSQTGALTPFTGDEHYSPAISLTLWVRNAINYLGRMVGAPLALFVLLGVSRLTGRRRQRSVGVYLISIDVLVFGAAFVAVFLAPVLPIPLRSELYLYLPVFGVCLFAGWLGSLLLHDIEPRSLITAIALYILALGAYQTAKGLAIERDLRFSEKLVAALRASPAVADFQGSVILVPADAETSRFLGDAVGDYLHLVLPYATGNEQVTGAVDYGRRVLPEGGLRLDCQYRDDDVIISRAAPSVRLLSSPA
jgi:hypothetical protein